ncbi:type I restriction enzyme endonuclease domain-containing protein [Candidatus Minimicrobia naudis]
MLFLTILQSGGQGAPQLDIAEAVAQMQMRYEVVRDLFGNFDYQRYFLLHQPDQQLQIILDAEEYILGLDDGEKRLKQYVLELE